MSKPTTRRLVVRLTMIDHTGYHSTEWRVCPRHLHQTIAVAVGARSRSRLETAARSAMHTPGTAETCVWTISCRPEYVYEVEPRPCPAPSPSSKSPENFES